MKTGQAKTKLLRQTDKRAGRQTERKKVERRKEKTKRKKKKK